MNFYSCYQGLVNGATKTIFIDMNGAKGDGITDDTNVFENAFKSGSNIRLVLGEGKTYVIKELTISDLSRVTIDGNGSRLKVKNNLTANSIFSFKNINHLIIKDLEFNGNYEKANLKDYMIKVTSSDRVSLVNIKLMDGDNGGVKIQDNGFNDKNEFQKSGAESILISSCYAKNVGRFAAINIRGSHKSVLIENCIGEDPLSRQHFSQGKMFEVSAEVSSKHAMLGKVVFRNCIVKNANKGFFAQQVEELVFIDCSVDKLGHKPVFYPNGKVVGVVAVKIDDLGEGNSARLQNFKVTNTAELDYKVFLALEESKGVGVTEGVVIDGFDTDADIRLGASGKHVVKNGILRKASVSYLSQENLVENIKVVSKKESIGVKFLEDKNVLKKSKFENSIITIYKGVQNAQIEDCSLSSSRLIHHFIAIDLNDPLNPNSVEIVRCSAQGAKYGIWSGGVKQQSKNLSVELKSCSDFNVHENIQK